MKKTVWKYGLIAGAILSLLMAATLPFMHRIGMEKGAVIGYSGMVLGFLLVFFGIRSYREHIGGGSIGFGRAFAIGALITLIASVCYTATWEVLYFEFMPNAYVEYEQHRVERAQAQGKSEAELAQLRAEAEKSRASYRNPVFIFAITLLEPLPVGLVIALVSAGILRRKAGERATVLESA